MTALSNSRPSLGFRCS